MRKFKHQLFKLVTAACAVIACGVLVIITVAIATRGLPAISWQFFTEQVRLVGAAGGIFYNLVGTFILIGTALVISAPIAVGLALVHGVYLREESHREKLTWLLYLLNGVPS